MMRQDPGFNLKRQKRILETPLLHRVCFEDRRSAVIPLLLAHPDIDVNQKDQDGFTPFLYACRSGSTSCVREMLKDSRVKLNEPAIDGHTPL